MNKVLVFLLLICCCGCMTQKNASMEVYQSANPQFTSGITFITFRLFKGADGVVSFNHYQTINADGELKDHDNWLKTDHSKYIIQLTANSGEPLMDLFFADPLNQSLEVFSPDGKIEGHEVAADEATVTFRFTTLRNSFTQAVLFKIDTDGEVKFLDKIKLH